MNNRQLKFRIWDKEKNRWTRLLFDNDGHYWGIGYKTSPTESSGSEPVGDGFGHYCYLLNQDRFSIQQFTGLLDKNGREIYEGDIYDLKGWTNNPYFCVFHEGEYWNRRIGQSDEEFFENHINVYPDTQHTLRGHFKYATVIGNIFENPELIKI